MTTLDLLFVAVLRFSLIACILLAACLGIVRLVSQPLERVRVIQIGFLALLTSLALSVAGVGPRVDLALLPAADSLDPMPAVATGIKPTADLDQVAAGSGDMPQAGGDMASAPGKPAGGRSEFYPLGPNASASKEAADYEPVAARSAQEQQDSQNAATLNVSLPMFLRRAAAVAFLVVSLVNLLFLAIGFLATRRLLANSRPLTETAAARASNMLTRLQTRPRAVRVVRSADIDVPMVVGIRRPTIMLPDTLASDAADPLELQHSLAHELAHIEQHDLVTWQVASLCQAILWIQPCYWPLRRELRVAQDQLADQFATEQTQQQADYATTLLEFARNRQPALPGALSMAGGKSNLHRRIEMLLNENFRMVRVPRRSLLLGLTAMLFVTGGLLASLNLTRAASPEAVADEPDKSERDKDAAVKPDAGKSAEHSGMVVDADTGEPIAGATVTVTRLESLNWKQLGVTKSVTDENGKYTFTIPPEQLRERLLYILFDVDHPQYAERHCGSYGYGMIVNNMKNGEEPWFAKLQMVRGEKLSGRLIDEAGRPVSGVQIRCSCRPASGFDRIRSAHIKGVSDEQGQFDLMVTAEGRAKLALIPPEHCMQQMDLGEKRGDIGDVVLKRGFSLRGIVQNAKGEPMRDLWVNIQPAEEQFRESYEMIRSSKIDDQGRFTTRPLQAGKYRINVENKATGALEKVKYANFHDDPPAAMFVTKSLNITEDLAAEPMIIRAVPHVLITAQFYKPNGELSPGHSPHVTGQFDGEFIWIPQGRRTGEGRFELMVPHGLVNVELRFTTNEHSGLMVQFPGGELSPQDSYRFERIEEDIDNIRIVRHRAGILKLDIVDESGKQLENSGIFAHYKLQQNPSDEVKAGTQIGWNRENGLFRLSSIVPGVPVAVRCSAPGYETSWAEYTLEAEQRRTVTVKLKKTDSKDGNQPAKGDAN